MRNIRFQSLGGATQTIECQISVGFGPLCQFRRGNDSLHLLESRSLRVFLVYFSRPVKLLGIVHCPP